MPKLPDVTALGGRPTPRATRSITSTAPVGRGVQRAANIQSQEAEQAGAGLMAAGQQLARIGDDFGAAHLKIQNRQDAVEIARGVSTLTEFSAGSLRDAQTQGNLSKAEDGKAYVSGLSKKIGEILDAAPMSRDGKARLSARLEGIRTHYVDMAAKLGLDEQKKLVLATDQEFVNAAASQIYDDPGRLPDILASYRAHVTDMAGAWEPGMEQGRLAAFNDIAIVAAMESALDKGGPDAIEVVERIYYDTPGIRQMLTPESHRKLFARIAKVKRERAAPRKPTVLGPGQQMRGPQGELLAQAPFKPQGYTLGPGQVRGEGGEIIARGPPAEPESPFGASADAHILQMFADRAVAFGQGGLSEQEDREFIAAVTDYAQTKTHPVTGMVIRGQVPEYVANALRLRGIPLPGDPKQADPLATIMGDTPPKLFEGGKTIIELGDRYTGPFSAVKQVLGRFPLFGQGSEVETVRRYILLVNRRLVTALMANPRYAVTERTSIEDDLDFDPKIWDSTQSFMDRVVGIDMALEGLETDLVRALQPDSLTSMKQRQHDENSLQILQAYRAKLMPHRAETAAEAIQFLQSNPPGTKVVVQNPEGQWIVKQLPQPEAAPNG